VNRHAAVRRPSDCSELPKELLANTMDLVKIPLQQRLRYRHTATDLRRRSSVPSSRLKHSDRGKLLGTSAEIRGTRVVTR
jgi:hypothetical protein